MVGDDDGFVAVGLGSLHDIVDTVVDSGHSFLDSFVDSGMSYHVAVGKVHDNPVVFSCADGLHELVLHLIGAHFGLEVVGSHLGTCYKDAVLTLEGRFASAVEEEGNVGIFFRFGGVELVESLRSDVFAEGVGDVLLREEDVHSLEAGVVGRHAVVLESGDGGHSGVGHVLLGEDDGEFLGAVVAEVEEDDYVALLDGAVHGSVVDGEYEFVSHAVVVALLHGFHHVGGILAFALHEEVVSHLHTFPTLVAVHGVESSDDAGDVCALTLAVCLEVGDESLTALGVGVAAVHEAVNEGTVFHTVFLGNVHKAEDVVEARVHAAGGGETHEVYSLSVVAGVGICIDDFRVLEDAAVGAGAVDLHEVLVYDAAGTDVEVSHLGVTHLTVGESDVFAAGLKGGMRIVRVEIVEVGCRGLEDDVALALVADSPTVENHKECFVCHNRYLECF